MKIALFIRNLAGVVGGAERAALSMAGAMTARGHQASIVTHERAAAPPHYPVPDGVTLVRLGAAVETSPPDPRPDAPSNAPSDARAVPPRRAPRRTKARPLRALAKRLEIESRPLRAGVWSLRNRTVVRDLADWLARERPDVAIAFLPTITPHLAAALQRVPTPSVLAFRNEPDYVLTASPGDLDGALRARWMRDALGRFDRLTVLAPQYLDQLPETVRDRALYIPNEVDVPQFAAARATPLLERPRRILFVGRLERQKRPALLLEAFASIAERAPDWRVGLFGAGAEELTLRASAERLGLSDRIDFHGVVSDMPAAYRSGQIICAPSAVEGFPRALSEAMAAGLAPVGFESCVGVANLLRDGAGRLAPEGDGSVASLANNLADALETVLDDGVRAAAAAAAARRAAEFTPTSVFDAWEELLRSLAARRQG
ncbi:MAG: glycosyltransferase [Pseudomonadota bacterium]